jgi:hypothetical protein
MECGGGRSSSRRVLTTGPGGEEARRKGLIAGPELRYTTIEEVKKKEQN